MKKEVFLLIILLTFFGANQLNSAADEGEAFVRIARRVAPEHYNLYKAGKIMPDEFFAIYEPTPEEPRMKAEELKMAAYSAWVGRSRERGWQPDPSDPKPEEGEVPYYDLFKAKVGSADKLRDVAMEIVRYRGSGEEISWEDKFLTFKPWWPKPSLVRIKDVTPEEGEALEAIEDDAEFEAALNALQEDLTFILFDVKK